jgi:hypothetical protein
MTVNQVIVTPAIFYGVLKDDAKLVPWHTASHMEHGRETRPFPPYI